RGADDDELSRLYDIPNEGTPRGAARQQETRSTFASWALDQNPADLHEFVAQYQFIRAEFVRRGKALEKQVEELMAREHLSLEGGRQRLGFGGRGQPPNVDEMVWRGLTDPAELARMGPRWRSQLFMVAGKTGSVPLPRGAAQPSPVPASDAETIAAVRTI